MKNKKSALKSYTFNIPLFLILFLAIGFVTVIASNKNNVLLNNTRSVLGDNDEDKEEKKEEKKKEEKKKESEKKRESEKKENEKKQEEAKKIEEKKREDYKKYEVKTTTSLNSESKKMDDTQNENEDTLEDERDIDNSSDTKDIVRIRERQEDFGDDNELEMHEDKAVVSSVVNEDGTVTKTIKNVDGNEIETKIITYDAAGKILNKIKLNEDGSEDTEKVELVTTVTNEDGSITKTFKKSEGDNVEMRSLTYDASGVLIKKAELNSDGSIKEEEVINEDDDSSVDNLAEDTTDETEVENEFKLVFKPLADGSVDPTLSKIISAKLEQEIENDSRLGTSVNKVELEIKTVDGVIKYEGTAESTEKLFGIFDVQISSDIEVDSVTGNITSVNQSFWTKVVNFLSF